MCRTLRFEIAFLITCLASVHTVASGDGWKIYSATPDGERIFLWVIVDKKPVYLEEYNTLFCQVMSADLTQAEYKPIEVRKHATDYEFMNIEVFDSSDGFLPSWPCCIDFSGPEPAGLVRQNEHLLSNLIHQTPERHAHHLL
jgi:hypothetical protein